jgi:hypothetical protein
MIISKKIYYSEKIKKRKREKYIKIIQSHKNLRGIFMLIIKEEDSNLMEVVNARELYRLDEKHSVIVIGLTKSREDAVLMIQDIISEYHQKNRLDKESLIKEFQ